MRSEDAGKQDRGAFLVRLVCSEVAELFVVSPFSQRNPTGPSRSVSPFPTSCSRPAIAVCRGNLRPALLLSPDKPFLGNNSTSIAPDFSRNAFETVAVEPQSPRTAARNSAHLTFVSSSAVKSGDSAATAKSRFPTSAASPPPAGGLARAGEARRKLATQTRISPA